MVYHQEVVTGLSQIIQSLVSQSRDTKTATNLDFIIEGLSLYAVDQSTNCRVLLASNKSINGQELFAWEPEQVAYGAIDSIIENVRDEFRGTGAPASERNARFLKLVRETFTNLALNKAYEPR